MRILKILSGILLLFSILTNCTLESGSEEPIVTIIEPVNGAEISGIAGIDFSIVASTYDDVDLYLALNVFIKPVSQHEFTDDDFIVGFYSSSIKMTPDFGNHSHSEGYFLDTTDGTYPNGEYTLQVSAEDTHGNFGYDEVKITISN